MFAAERALAGARLSVLRRDGGFVRNGNVSAMTAAFKFKHSNLSSTKNFKGPYDRINNGRKWRKIEVCWLMPVQWACSGVPSAGSTPIT